MSCKMVKIAREIFSASLLRIGAHDQFPKPMTILEVCYIASIAFSPMPTVSGVLDRFSVYFLLIYLAASF